MKKYIKRKENDINIWVRKCSKFHSKKRIVFENVEERKEKVLYDIYSRERKLECV